MSAEPGGQRGAWQIVEQADPAEPQPVERLDDLGFET